MNFLRSESGTATIEMALLLPVFLFLVLGVMDYSLAIEQQMCVTEAAASGAAYASLVGHATDQPGIESAAGAAVSGIHGFRAAASSYWTCSPGGAQVDSNSTCSAGQAPMQWVEVHTSASANSIFDFPGLPNSISLQATAIHRVLR